MPHYTNATPFVFPVALLKEGKKAVQDSGINLENFAISLDWESQGWINLREVEWWPLISPCLDPIISHMLLVEKGGFVLALWYMLKYGEDSTHFNEFIE